MVSKKTTGAFAAGAVCMGALAFAIAAGPEDQKGMPEMSAETAAEMQAWMELSQLNEHHEQLTKYVGEWDVAAWFKMDPNAPAMESSGSMVTEPVMGGRYTKSNFHMPEWMGAPFDGIAYMGYDNAQQKYVSTWMDSWSTGIMMSTGTMSSDGSQLIMMGTMQGPEGEEMMKMVTEWVDDNTIVDRFYDLADGEWNLHGKMTYTRKGHAHGG